MFINKINIPKILSKEEVLIQYENEKELKTLFDKVKKNNNYYIVYTFEDENKTIDAFEIRNIIKMLYKKAVFYIVEKDEDGYFEIFAGDTVSLNESTFKKFKIDIVKIDNLKKILFLNENFLGIDKKVVFFINVATEEKEKILNVLKAKEENINKLTAFIFPGKSFVSKYKSILAAIIINIAIFTGIKYYLTQKQQEILQRQAEIINMYQNKINKTKKEIAEIQKQIQFYQIPKNISIYKGIKND